MSPCLMRIYDMIFMQAKELGLALDLQEDNLIAKVMPVGDMFVYLPHAFMCVYIHHSLCLRTANAFFF